MQASVYLLYSITVESSHLNVQHFSMSVYITSGHTVGHSMRLPLLMKSFTSLLVIFCSTMKESKCYGCFWWDKKATHCAGRWALVHSETQRYLVRFSSVRKGFPHCDAKTPHITFAGELAEVNAFRSVPLQGPFSRCSSLQEKNQKGAG